VTAGSSSKEPAKLEEPVIETKAGSDEARHPVKELGAALQTEPSKPDAPAKDAKETREKSKSDVSSRVDAPRADGAERKGKKSVGRSSSAPSEDESVPPVGDLAVDEKFFMEGDLAATDGLDAHDALTVLDKAKRKADPVVIQRRERFVRYVKWAVAGAGVVCLAALARTALTPTRPEPMHATATVAPPPETIPAATKAAEPAVAPKAAEPAAAPKPVEPTTSPGVAEHAAPTSTMSTTETAQSKPEAVSADPKAEKAKARSLLENRRLVEAIAAGERSVALDPTDGEAWLILGAAYQEKGNMVEARRAYASCVKEGKTGPRDECSKMLR
jgi:hypothetical protein